MIVPVVALDGSGAAETAVFDRLRLKAAVGKCAPGQRVSLPGTLQWPITLLLAIRHLDCRKRTSERRLAS